MTEGTPVPQPERLTPSPEGTYELTTPGFTIKATVTGSEFTKIIYSPIIKLEDLDQNLQGASPPPYDFIITPDLKNNTIKFSIRFDDFEQLTFTQTGDNLLLVTPTAIYQDPREERKYTETPLDEEIADGKFKLYGPLLVAVERTKEGLITVSYPIYTVRDYIKATKEKVDFINVVTAGNAALLVAEGGGSIEIQDMFEATIPTDLNSLTPPNREKLLELLQGLYDGLLNSTAIYSVRLAHAAKTLESRIISKYRKPTKEEINQIKGLLKDLPSVAKEQWDKSLQARSKQST